MGAACHACIGGTNVSQEIRKLCAESPHIVVGTPGRVFDMINRGYLCEYNRTAVSVATHFTKKNVYFNNTFLRSFKVHQDVCTGWSWRDVESRVQRSDLWDLPEAECQHSSKNFFGSFGYVHNTRHLKCWTWNPSALTEFCYNCVIQILSVSCNNASRVLRGRRLLPTALKMRCCRTSFLMFVGFCLKVQCHTEIYLIQGVHRVLKSSENEGS